MPFQWKQSRFSESFMKHTSTIYGDTQRRRMWVCFKGADSSFSSLSVLTAEMQLVMLAGQSTCPLAAPPAPPAKAITAVCGHSWAPETAAKPENTHQTRDCAKTQEHCQHRISSRAPECYALHRCLSSCICSSCLNIGPYLEIRSLQV